MASYQRDFEAYAAIVLGPFILLWKLFKLVRRLWRNETRVTTHHAFKSPEWERKWRRLRYDFVKFAKQNNAYYCHARGCQEGPFQVDHIKPKSLYPHLSLAWPNLQILCGSRTVGGCNQTKSNTDCIDWRPDRFKRLVERNRKMIHKWP